MLIYPLFNPFAWAQVGLDAMAAAASTMPQMRSGLLRHHIGNLKLCTACQCEDCKKRRAPFKAERDA